MKNQAQLMVKKPPTKLKTQVNIYSKKENPTTSVDPKPRFPPSSNQNNDPSSLKKRSPYSPRNQYISKQYAQGRNQKIDEVKKQLAAIKTKAVMLNNDLAEPLPLLKSKSTSEYKPFNEKLSLPVDSQAPKLQAEQLKSRVSFYQRQISDLQSKIIRLETAIKEKENSKVNFDIKLDTQKFIQISNLKQQLSAAGYRERSLTDEKKLLMQNQLQYEKRIEELEIMLIAERKERQEVDRNKPSSTEESRANQRRLIDRHTEIIRAKEKEITQMKNSAFEYQQKIHQLEKQLYKLKLLVPDKPFPNPTTSDNQKQSLKTQIQKLNFELLRDQEKYRSAKNNLEKEISNYLREIHSLTEKNQELERVYGEQLRLVGELQGKCARVEGLKGEESRRLMEMTVRCGKLEEEMAVVKNSHLNSNNSNVSKSLQTEKGKAKHDDIHQQLNAKNSMIEKLHATNKNLESSANNAHQLEKKLKMNEAMLHEANATIMKMKLQSMNRKFSNFEFY